MVWFSFGMFGLVGVTVGCLSAWYWISRESRND